MTERYIKRQRMPTAIDAFPVLATTLLTTEIPKKVPSTDANPRNRA